MPDLFLLLAGLLGLDQYLTSGHGFWMIVMGVCVLAEAALIWWRVVG